MNWFLRHTLKLGNFMWELFLATIGGFVFARGSRFVTRGYKQPAGAASSRYDASPLMPFAGMSIAIFLLVFIAGEALTMVHAFGHESPVAIMAPASTAVLGGAVTLPVVAPLKRSVRRPLHRTPSQPTSVPADSSGPVATPLISNQ